MPKIRIVFFVITFAFVAVEAKLAYIQVLNAQTPTENRYLQYRKLQPERGRIFDRQGRPLVTNQTKYQVYVEPPLVTNMNDVIEAIDEVTQIGEATIEARINPKLQWAAVAAGLDEAQKVRLEQKKIKGIGFDPQPARFYPEASLSSHLVGFVGKNQDGDNLGYGGIEGYYEQDLTGLPGLVKADNDVSGRMMLSGNRERISSHNGRDLYLTIDNVVQHIVKEKLQSGMERFEAASGCAIVANPQTMEILSMVCLPDFDPEFYYKSTDDVFANQAISTVYEPGSTFKPLIVAAGIEDGKITPDTKMNEDGPVKVSEYSIRTWNNDYAGNITMTQVLEKSSNVGMVYIGQKLGDERVYDYIHRYGFGELTGIDLQGEAPAYLKPKDSWYKIDYATATFGQGLAVTPLQLVRAFSSVINGGKLLRPYVVSRAVSANRTQEFHPRVETQVLHEKTSRQVVDMLVSTVENGEYRYAIPEGFHGKIGGKTGTAQIAVSGKYDASKTIASFIGFAPADNPKFVALVIYKEPKSSIYGSETAAPVFFDIARELLVYYQITPDQ